MFCTKCGVQLEDSDCFCHQCGARTPRAISPVRPEKLTRSVTDKKIAGVCGGFAEYLAMDPTVVRLLWVLLSLGLPPAGILGYIAAWIIIPKQEAFPVMYAPAPARPQV